MKKEEKVIAESIVKLSKRQQRRAAAKQKSSPARWRGKNLLVKARHLGRAVVPPKRYRLAGIVSLAVAVLVLVAIMAFRLGHEAGMVDGVAAYKAAECQKSTWCRMTQAWDVALKRTQKQTHGKIAQR